MTQQWEGKMHYCDVCRNERDYMSHVGSPPPLLNAPLWILGAKTIDILDLLGRMSEIRGFGCGTHLRTRLNQQLALTKLLQTQVCLVSHAVMRF